MRNASVVLALIVVGCTAELAERSNARGRECYERRDYRCAVREFGFAVREEPDVHKYRYNLGLALARAGAFEQSKTELQTLLRMDPGHSDARNLLIRVQANISWSEGNSIATQLAR